MLKIISDVFMYIFEALLLYNYADGLFVSKNKTSVKVAGVAAANVILFLFYQLKFEFANGILLLGLYYLVFRFIFNVKTLTAIFHSFLCISVMLVSEMVILNLCSVIFDDFAAMHSDMSAYVFVITTSKILYFAVIMGIKNRDSSAAMPAMSLIGVTIFLLIWEARARYILNFLPLFILMAVFGIKQLFYHNKNQ